MQASGGIRYLRGYHPEESGERARSAGSSGSSSGKLYCRRGPGGYPESAESRGGTDGTGRIDQEAYEKAMKKEGYEDGYQEGIEQGIERGIRGVIRSLKEFDIPKEQILQKLQDTYELTEEEARGYIEKYW